LFYGFVTHADTAVALVSFVSTQVKEMIREAAEIGQGKIDSLVNVAGVDIIAKLEDTDPER
jgi:NADP-dependent 3-hydroxy acid dehydrogenase YdfG